MQRMITACAAVLLLHGVCPGATLKVLHAFGGNPDGAAPESNLIFDGAGHLYGTTYAGGTGIACLNGCGTIFQLTPPVAPSTTWTETLLYTFGPKQNALLPSFNLVGTGTGTGPFYGTTFTGASTSLDCFEATTGCGMVFVLRPPVAPSTTWTFNTLAVFNSDNGGGPTGVIMGPTAGTLYGATYDGGLSGGYGTVFQVTF